MKKPFAKTRIDYVANLASPRSSDNVLSIGVSNIPELESILEKKIKKLFIIDIDSKKITNAKDNLPKTKFICEDITSPKKINGKKFNIIIMLEVLEHLEQDLATIKIINKLLNKNGKLILSVPNTHWIHIINPLKYTQHKRHYALNNIKHLLEKNGFIIEHINTVESFKLLIDLYVHLVCKYIFRKTRKFGFLTGKSDKTYAQMNSENNGLDTLILAKKIKDI